MSPPTPTLAESRDIVERTGREEADDAGLLDGAAAIIEAHFLTTFGTDRLSAIRRAASLRSQLEAVEKEREELRAFMKELSNALLKVRPLGGSELFVKRFGEYYADPAWCGAAMEEKDRRFNDAMKDKVRAERALVEATTQAFRAGAEWEREEAAKWFENPANFVGGQHIAELLRARSALATSADTDADAGGGA